MRSDERSIKKRIPWDRDPRVSILQTRLYLGDVDRNLASAMDLLKIAGEEGSDISVLPEMFSTGFPYDVLPDLSKRSGEVIGSISDRARDHSMNVIFTQVIDEEGDYVNRMFHIDRYGKIVSSYDKTHLFSRADEDRFFKPGNELKIMDIDSLKVGPLICYEVRFPELSRRLVLEGAELLIYAAQWPAFRTFQWEAMLKARAIENQCYVAGVNIYGQHGENMMGGKSRLFSPYGDILAAVDEGEGYGSAVLSEGYLLKIRENIPVLKEIRNDIVGP